jgi:hypothetical protein
LRHAIGASQSHQAISQTEIIHAEPMSSALIEPFLIDDTMSATPKASFRRDEVMPVTPQALIFASKPYLQLRRHSSGLSEACIQYGRSQFSCQSIIFNPADTVPLHQKAVFHHTGFVLPRRNTQKHNAFRNLHSVIRMSATTRFNPLN